MIKSLISVNALLFFLVLKIFPLVISGSTHGSVLSYSLFSWSVSPATTVHGKNQFFIYSFLQFSFGPGRNSFFTFSYCLGSNTKRISWRKHGTWTLQMVVIWDYLCGTWNPRKKRTLVSWSHYKQHSLNVFHQLLVCVKASSVSFYFTFLLYMKKQTDKTTISKRVFLLIVLDVYDID